MLPSYYAQMQVHVLGEAIQINNSLANGDQFVPHLQKECQMKGWCSEGHGVGSFSGLFKNKERCCMFTRQRGCRPENCFLLWKEGRTIGCRTERHLDDLMDHYFQFYLMYSICFFLYLSLIYFSYLLILKRHTQSWVCGFVGKALLHEHEVWGSCKVQRVETCT